MAQAFTRYEGPAEVYINGRLMAEAKSTSIKISANNNPVLTMAKGLAGKSDGPRQSEATIENAVPIKGFEVAFHEHLLTGATVTLTIRTAGQRWNIPMWVEEVDLTNATDKDAGYSATLKGGTPVIR